MVRGVPRDVLPIHGERLMGRRAKRLQHPTLATMKGSVLAPISMLGRSSRSSQAWRGRSREQGNNPVGITYIGDGGASCGDFHEGLNMAATLNSPLC